MLREAKEIESWMQESEAVVTCEEVAEDMDGIEIFQKEYDEFKQDMVVQEQRIKELQLLCCQLKVNSVHALVIGISPPLPIPHFGPATSSKQVP